MLIVNGVRIGFAQVGVTFDPEEAFTRARLGQFSSGSEVIQFLVMDPVTLCREKHALSLKRNQRNDRLHFETLREYLCREVVNLCQKYTSSNPGALADEQQTVSLLLDMKSRAVEILKDPRVRRRVQLLPSKDSEQKRFLQALVDEL